MPRVKQPTFSPPLTLRDPRGLNICVMTFFVWTNNTAFTDETDK